MDTSVPELQLMLLEVVAADDTEPPARLVLTFPDDPTTGVPDVTSLITAAGTLIRHLARELAAERDTTATEILDALWLDVRVNLVGRQPQRPQ